MSDIIEKLQRRLSDLESETLKVYSELGGSRAGAELPGLFLLVETGADAALLPASAVREIVPIVELQPLSGAGPTVLGAFVYRGDPAVAVALEPGRRFSVDAHMLMLNAGRAIALVADRVESLVSGVRLEAVAAPTARGVVALCRIGDRVVRLLSVPALIEQASGEATGARDGVV